MLHNLLQIEMQALTAELVAGSCSIVGLHQVVSESRELHMEITAEMHHYTVKAVCPVRRILLAANCLHTPPSQHASTWPSMFSTVVLVETVAHMESSAARAFASTVCRIPATAENVVINARVAGIVNMASAGITRKPRKRIRCGKSGKLTSELEL